MYSLDFKEQTHTITSHFFFNLKCRSILKCSVSNISFLQGYKVTSLILIFLTSLPKPANLTLFPIKLSSEF